LKSTGPKSNEGKIISALRGYKGSTRPLLRELNLAMRQQLKSLN
jgi:hypothetical protein